MKKVLFFLIFCGLFFSSNLSYAQDSNSYESLWYDEDGNVNSAISVTIEYDGLVPCGRCLSFETSAATPPQSQLDGIYDCPEGTIFVPCQLCHLFIVFDRIISFVLVGLIPIIALIVITLSGLMMIIGGSNPELITKAKNALLYSVIGIFLAYASWLIIVFSVGFFLDWDVNWIGITPRAEHLCLVEIRPLGVTNQNNPAPAPPATGNGTTQPPATGNGTTPPPATGNGTTQPPATGNGTTPPQTSPATQAPQIMLNSAETRGGEMISCFEICKNINRNCESIGTDTEGTNGRIQNSFANSCNMWGNPITISGNCHNFLQKPTFYSPTCYGHGTQWTRCRCIIE